MMTRCARLVFDFVTFRHSFQRMNDVPTEDITHAWTLPMNTVYRFLKSEDGPTSVEYAVMLALIIGTCIAVVKTLGGSTGGLWANNNQKLQDAGVF